ncbi:MAG TPA: kelch repeat-containing protein [Acidimicrobiales bacterium]|nr:kelch repeat-containing protein [Acidimicrobiales bacterium]
MGPARAALQGEWTDAGDLGFGRIEHTATMLADGATVLVAGGRCDLTTCHPLAKTDATASVELYEDGSWREGPAMVAARQEHVATLLDPSLCHPAPPAQPPDGYPCGSVLVVGGEEELAGEARLSTAELYDPEAGTWKSCPVLGADATCPGVLLQRRIGGHTATLLDGPACRSAAPPPRCGKVLVVGGSLSPGSAELYDPRTGTWAAAASLETGQEASSHTATLLPDGRVLLAGGGTGSYHRYSHVYDPVGDQWATTKQLNLGRVYHTATLLSDGRVLVAGGSGRSAEVFDPDADAWSVTGSMGTVRAFHSAAVVAGHVLVTGGKDGGGEFLDSAEVYEPATGAWTATAGLGDGQAREGHTAISLPGSEVLVVGGRTPTGNGSILNASTKRYRTTTAPVPVVTGISPDHGPSAGNTEVTITGHGFVGFTEVRFGGVPASGAPMLVSDGEIKALTPRDRPPGTVDVQVVHAEGLSPPVAAGRFTYVDAVGWSSANGFTIGVGPTATALPSGQVLVAGGAPNLYRNRGPSQIWDPPTGTWRRTGSSARSHSSATATLLSDGRVLLAGGTVGSLDPTPDAEVYDPDATGVAPTESITEIFDVPTVETVQGGWAPTAPMIVPGRAQHTSTLLADGSVLVVGGDRDNASDTGLTTAERFHPQERPATGWWSPAGTLSSAIAGHTASLLPDGRVLVVGGCTDKRCSSGPAPSTYIYDPESNSWTAGPTMAYSRGKHTATTMADGKVLVAGGCSGVVTREAACTAYSATAEVFDPASETWGAASPLLEARERHAAALLPGGKVLATGGSSSKAGSDVVLTSAELYDPIADTWSPAAELLTRRGDHDVVVLPEGPASVCGANCGKMFIVGHLQSSELYAPPPEVTGVTPATGPTAGGTAVAIVGSGFSGVTSVGFGPFAAASFAPDPERPATRLLAVTPKHGPGVADVAVATSPATGVVLESVPAAGGRFSYFAPDRPLDLVASVVSDTAIRLDFLAPDDPLATRYVVKQGASSLDTGDAFDAAPSLCGVVCDLSPEAGQAPPDRQFLVVDDLTPGTTYHFALRAQRPDQSLGPRSASVSATTSGVAPQPLPRIETGCRAVDALAPNEVAYPAGYSLIGLPAGTVVGSQSPLYGWLDLGAGGGYSARTSSEPVTGGHGQWAYFSCPKVLGPLAPGDKSVRLPLGAYRASMVGNPSGTSRASVTGYDYAASWNPALNDGAGGYALSGYREAQTLDVGQGTWVFAYARSEIAIAAQG